MSAERYCSNCGAANKQRAGACFACGESLKITQPLSAFDTSSAHLLRGRYRILEQVGYGGFSAVYKAEDTQYNNRRVAIKAVHFHGMKPTEIIEATDAFNREVQLLTGLKHSNLPRIYDHFSDTECWYMVMDFIEGVTLEKHLEKMAAMHSHFPLSEVCDIGILLCGVLEYLHSRQPVIIFRDLKPANIILTLDGHLALIDFGIARHFKPGQARDTMPFGSPGYAAPEQYGKAQTTPRADIYSLGAMLHQLITGDDPSQTPFRFAPLNTKGQSALIQLETLILQMVEMDVSKRPENITMVKQQLEEIAQEQVAYQGLQGISARSSSTLTLQRPMASWQTLASAPQIMAGGVIKRGKNGQLLLVQQPIGGMGGAIPSMHNWSIPQPGTNKFAVASMILGILSLVLPLFMCSIASNIYPYVSSSQTPLMLILLLVTPPILAVIFGHISNHRAKTIFRGHSSSGMATTGLVLGYIFSFIYGGIMCLMLTFMMLGSIH